MSHPGQAKLGIIGTLKTADLGSTGDQAITPFSTGQNYLLQGIYGVSPNATPSSVTCAIYTGTSKSGTALCNVSSSLQSLTPGTTDIILVTVNSSGKLLRSSSPLYFSCTGTNSGKTCDILLNGGYVDSSASNTTNGRVRSLRANIYGEESLGILKTGNMNVTTDQAITMQNRGLQYTIAGHQYYNGSTTFSVSSTGVYTGTSKSGTQVIATGTSIGLTPGTTDVNGGSLSSPSAGSGLTNSTLYFSITSTAGLAATCDFELYAFVEYK